MTWEGPEHIITPQVDVYWDGVTATQEQSNVIEMSIQRSLYDQSLGLPGLGQTQPGRAELLLDNSGNRFSPGNEDSPLWDHIKDGIYRKKVQIWMADQDTFPLSFESQFVGEIDLPREWQQYNDKSVSFSCVEGVRLLQHKHTTAMLVNQRADQVIAALLAQGDPAAISTLDVGMSIIPFAWLDDENIWAECQRLAAADGGLFYVGNDGTYRFERMTHWVEGSQHTMSMATLTRGRMWYLEDRLAWRDCYTGVIVERAPRYMGNEQEVYAAPDTIAVPPGDSVSQTIRLRTPVSDVVTPVADTDYMAVSAGMANLAGDLAISITPYAQRADITFANYHASQTIYVMQFKLRAIPVLGDEAQETAANSALGIIPGQKVWALRGNPYIQSAAQAEQLANFLRDRLERPRRLLAWRGPAIPHLDLGHRVTITDAESGVDTDAYVLSIKQSYRRGSPWEMEVTALPVQNLYPVASYFILGTSEYGAATDALFY